MNSVEDEAKHGTASRPISISPPPKRRRVTTAERPSDKIISPKAQDSPKMAVKSSWPSPSLSPRVLPSPVQLNFVEQLPPASNVNTISLGSILGDVMIRECWLFNYLFDVDFVMSQFDPDIKDTVKVNIVHGSWRNEDMNKISIEEAAKRHTNVKVTTAYMPEPFGTHHSKMIILLRHDDLAQVVILTGNLIQRDWSMSQAIWRSPLLPLCSNIVPYSPSVSPLGSGPRFKYELMAYLKHYGAKLKALITQLEGYDFGEIRAALVASAPGKQNVRSTDPNREPLWGWPGLKHILSSIPSQSHRVRQMGEETILTINRDNRTPQIAIQVSSIASVGEKWLNTTLFPALSAIKTATRNGSITISVEPQKPRFSIIFPTADTIRRCVDGYRSGASIHMKTQTSAQAKQLSDIRPMLCHWAGAPTSTPFTSSTTPATPLREAGRKRAAPHIKTYTRFSDGSMTKLDWAMLTSANLSTQAWGSAASAAGDVRICSYEIGVIVWPALWSAEAGGDAEMVPTFGTDTPVVEDSDDDEDDEDDDDDEEDDEESRDGESSKKKKKITVGWRMPYDLPLVPYGRDERPWCATEPCAVPDWRGRVWPGHGR